MSETEFWAFSTLSRSARMAWLKLVYFLLQEDITHYSRSIVSLSWHITNIFLKRMQRIRYCGPSKYIVIIRRNEMRLKSLVHCADHQLQRTPERPERRIDPAYRKRVCEGWSNGADELIEKNCSGAGDTWNKSWQEKWFCRTAKPSRKPGKSGIAGRLPKQQIGGDGKDCWLLVTVQICKICTVPSVLRLRVPTHMDSCAAAWRSMCWDTMWVDLRRPKIVYWDGTWWFLVDFGHHLFFAMYGVQRWRIHLDTWKCHVCATLSTPLRQSIKWPTYFQLILQWQILIAVDEESTVTASQLGNRY